MLDDLGHGELELLGDVHAEDQRVRRKLHERVGHYLARFPIADTAAQRRTGTKSPIAELVDGSVRGRREHLAPRRHGAEAQRDA